MRRHSTATLMGMNKRELVEYVRMAEHNQDVAEETLKQQAENVKDWIPVVRCKDCKYLKKSQVKDCYRCANLLAGMTSLAELKGDEFCSYGERRDGE